jgi:hypothetical protein
MSVPGKQIAALFVDRSSQQGIVRDPVGNCWILSSVEDPWDHRLTFDLTAEKDLEPVPGHYKDMLKLPF